MSESGRLVADRVMMNIFNLNIPVLPLTIPFGFETEVPAAILGWFLVMTSPAGYETKTGPFMNMEACAHEMFIEMQTDKENIFTCEQSNIILLPPNR